ncbi:MAG: response regulator [Deltaproteobacteria bacterium]|jgi:signal transduction histidine kinase/DNA-binding response OmpR family regulator|nr:response regulator [Deltaproteobacteria bacterium]
MLEVIPGLQHISLDPAKLLAEGEVIAIVDDDTSIREPLRIFLESNNMAVVEAGSANELRSLFSTVNIALILLDIGLPDTDGVTLLPEIVNDHPGTGIIMLTGMADLEVALDCIRKGADDYLSKPVQFQEILLVARKVLERRLLISENLKYQKDLEKAHFRIQLVHQLSLKMNSVYLSTVELDEILQAILVGITAEEGLRFNRAFLVIFDNEGKVLQGKLGIGSECRNEAGRIWAEMRERQLDFLEIVQNIRKTCLNGDTKITQTIKNLQVPVTDSEHILIKVALEKHSILVENGQAEVPVDRNLIDLLGEDTFVVVPLFSPSKSLGVIIADNFVTRLPITKNSIRSLEIFANQASLAIEHSRLYMEMEDKIRALEEVTEELEKNKDLLVESASYSALGQMSAQLVHVLRNPITSIGGAARILGKRVDDKKTLEFVHMIVNETSRLESTLKDLFDFVTHPQADKKCEPLYPLLRKSMLLLQPTLVKNSIELEYDIAGPDPILEMDEQLIRKMIIHLARNAIEAMPDGGTLTIAVRQQRGWVTISFIDTGTGIAKAIQDRAVDPFFTTKTFGTGLGLTLVEKIIETHGGNFSLIQKPEGGVEAKINLPEKTACSFGI